MGNETHIKWLLEGKTRWNARRKAQEFCPDFSFADIPERFREAEKLDPNGRVRLSGYNLNDAVFRSANLKEVDLEQACLRRAKMTGARLGDTSFAQADLSYAEFSVGSLNNSNLIHATLENTELVQTNLTQADLGGSRYWQARLYPRPSPPPTKGPRLDLLKTIRSALKWIRRDFKSTSHHVDRSRAVNSVADLIDRCFEIGRVHKDLTLYFRGERDYRWELRPSVMRPSDDGTFKLRANEGEMLRNLISRRPEDFSGMTSTLEQVVMAQHHGLRTRLFDVTRNPCVALFSACDSRDAAGRSHDNDMDGRLHIFAVPKALIKPFDSDTISIISNFAKLDRGYQNLLLGRTAGDSLAEDPPTPPQYVYSKAMRRLYHFIRQEKPQFEKIIDHRDFFRVFIVEPKQSFERIRAQEGAFLVSAFHERFEKCQVLCHNKDIPVYEYDTLTVPREKKDDILKELDMLNFNRETLYPGLDEVANKITQDFA